MVEIFIQIMVAIANCQRISLYDTQDHLQIGKPNEERTRSLNVRAADKRNHLFGEKFYVVCNF